MDAVVSLLFLFFTQHLALSRGLRRPIGGILVVSRPQWAVITACEARCASSSRSVAVRDGHWVPETDPGCCTHRSCEAVSWAQPSASTTYISGMHKKDRCSDALTLRG